MKLTAEDRRFIVHPTQKVAWPSNTLGTLDLGRNKLKRANRAYSKALAKNVLDDSKANRVATDVAWSHRVDAQTQSAAKIERALKKLDR